MLKIGNCKIFECPVFQRRPKYTLIPNMNMNLFIEIKHNNLIQCHRDYILVEKLNYMLRIDILRNNSHNCLHVLKGDSKGFGCPNGTHKCPAG